MLTNDIEILKKALERERKSRELAESFVENRLRELYVSNIHLSNRVLTQEEFQNDLLDNLVDALFVIDFKGEILKINKEATKLLGLDNDLKVNNISQFSNRNKKGIKKLLSKDNLENENEVLFYEFINEKNQKKYVTIKSKILVDSEKNPYAYQAIVRDVSEKYLLELKIQKQQQFEKLESQILKDLLKSNDIFTNAFDLVNHIAQFLNSDDCVIYGFINRKLVQLATTTTKLDANHIIKNKLSRSIDKGVVGRVIRSKKGEIINDTSKDKDYLINLIKKLPNVSKDEIKRIDKLTREDICNEIRNKLLYLEKYSTSKDNNKMTYVMIPINHRNLPFPFNLEDRIKHHIKKINQICERQVDVKVKKIKGGTFLEETLPDVISYEMIFKNEKFMLQNKDIQNEFNKLGFILKGSEWIKLLD